MKDYSIVIYPSMACPFRELSGCPYCWVDHYEAQTGVSGVLEPLSWERWAEFLLRLPPAVVDIVGGEPLAWPGLYDLLQAISGHHEWALTTNLVPTRNYQRLVLHPLPNCAQITWSYHPRSPQDMGTGQRFRVLRTIYGPERVSASVVRWGDIPAGEIAKVFGLAGVRCAINDYQPPQGNHENEAWQSCNGGHRHIVVATDGSVYPCFALFERADRTRWRLGSIDTFEFQARRMVCRQECGPCYRAPGDPFRIGLEPSEAPR